MNPIITTDAWSYKLFEQYLNTFFRELQVQLEQHILSEQDSPLTIHDANNSSYFSYPFTASNSIIYGAIQHFSSTGYHRYQRSFCVFNTEDKTVKSLTDPKVLVKMITDELKLNQRFKDKKQNQNLYAEIANSIENTKFFLENSVDQIKPKLASSFQSAEQGMLYGHPFHVTSKANLGFSKEDMKKYSPELSEVGS